MCHSTLFKPSTSSFQYLLIRVLLKAIILLTFTWKMYLKSRGAVILCELLKLTMDSNSLVQKCSLVRGEIVVKLVLSFVYSQLCVVFLDVFIKLLGLTELDFISHLVILLSVICSRAVRCNISAHVRWGKCLCDEIFCWYSTCATAL